MDEDKLKPLTKTDLATLAKYYQCWNGTRAWMATHPRSSYNAARASAAEWLAKPNIKAAIDDKLAEMHMSANEALQREAEIGRVGVGFFFKITDEWMFNPLPEYEILDEKETEVESDDGKKEKRVSYRVRHAVLDMDKVIDPQYAHLIKKFSNSRRNGVSIETYDGQTVHRDVINYQEKAKEKAEKVYSGESTQSLVIPAELIAPDFLASHRAILSGLYDEFIEDGGRGSTKSSFISLEIISLLVNDKDAHALALRQVKDTLRDSVYSQLVWAINVLGLAEKFNCTTSPLEITYLPTGQKVYFRGADDPMKIKSIKPTFGAIKILWFEELDSFHGAETVRNIEQSAIRGTDKAYIFKSFNPPRTAGNWANKYTLIPKPRQWHHKSNYLTVPAEWLGRVFLDEAEHLKNVNLRTYEHEYLGIVNGDGGMVFDNVQLREITDAEIKQFDNVLHGGDWGFYPDPFSYGAMHYDAARRILYIFSEARWWKKNNEDSYKTLKQEHGLQDNDLLIMDSAEPKSVMDFVSYGSNCRGAEKGKESRKYSYKWLQGLTAIVIDPKRAPYHVEEFTSCEFERTKDGEIISEYPQVNDHAIDDTRYATNLIWRQRGQ